MMWGGEMHKLLLLYYDFVWTDKDINVQNMFNAGAKIIFENDGDFTKIYTDLEIFDFLENIKKANNPNISYFLIQNSFNIMTVEYSDQHFVYKDSFTVNNGKISELKINKRPQL